MKKRKLKLKKRNFTLLIIGFILSLCFLLEAMYTHWIFAKVYLVDASEAVTKCVQNHHLLLSDCLYSFQDENLIKTSDNNLRYIGNNPNNYIDLGSKYTKIIYRGYSKSSDNDYKDFTDMTSCLDENRKCSIIHQENSPILWRIVGVFTIDGLTYTKLVSDDSIGKYSWDNKEDNDKKGINEWSTSSLKQLLNEKDYYQKINDFAENGLENNKIIAELNWQLGSISEEDMPNLKANDWYNNEHNDHLETCDFGKYCTDTLERTSKVNSKVGLLYPSDIMFSTNCSDKTTKEWDKTCESYLTINKPNYWLMTPITSTNSKAYATTFQNNSGFTASFVANEAHIFPVIYLKHTIKIKGGHGTIEKPFLIS